MNKDISYYIKIIPIMGIILTMNSAPAYAADGTYQFVQVGKPTMTNGKDTVRVKLVNTVDDKVVTNAVILKNMVYMGPLSQPAMTAPVTALPATNGIYKFVIGPAMDGTWLLHLVAKIPGHSATISGTLTVDVTK